MVSLYSIFPDLHFLTQSVAIFVSPATSFLLNQNKNIRISNDINANQNLSLDDETITWNWNPHQVKSEKHTVNECARF